MIAARLVASPLDDEVDQPVEEPTTGGDQEHHDVTASPVDGGNDEPVLHQELQAEHMSSAVMPPPYGGGPGTKTTRRGNFVVHTAWRKIIPAEDSGPRSRR